MNERIKELAEQADIVFGHYNNNEVICSAIDINKFAELIIKDQQREWVGLTKEERDSITDEVIGWNSCVGWEYEYACAIEAKLKEKNTFQKRLAHDLAAESDKA